jgi:hypothetical protein
MLSRLFGSGKYSNTRDVRPGNIRTVGRASYIAVSIGRSWRNSLDPTLQLATPVRSLAGGQNRSLGHGKDNCVKAVSDA